MEGEIGKQLVKALNDIALALREIRQQLEEINTRIYFK